MSDDVVNLLKIPSNGIITGVIRHLNIVQSGVKVRLYSIMSGILLDETVSNISGVYKFVGLDPMLIDGYQVMALNPKLESPFLNTIVYDRRYAIPE
jgi:hypothetical protein